ncbi:MAG: sporulation protein YqfD [Clostridiales bacterium]|nr:sporulation protein YqfD [Clostridiales bacterium]
MRRSIGLIAGSAKVKISGRRPELALNELSGDRLVFWGVRKTSDNEILLSIIGRDLKKAEAACNRASCAIIVLSKKGLPYILMRFKKRYVFYFAPVLSILIALYLSFFIWEIEITGNETVTEGEILTALEQVGVHIGTFGPKIDQEIVRSEVIALIGKLSWMTVNVYGCKAEVIVRERIDKPEIINESEPSEVRADKTGLITQINVYTGKPLVKKGDMVFSGQTLITGQLDSIGSGVRFVHAMGDVTARTWYKLSAGMPLEYITKRYTGENIERRSIMVGNIRVNLYFNAGISMVNYDKITTSERIHIGGFHLPVSLITTTYRAYEPIKAVFDTKEAEALLKSRLLKRLSDLGAKPTVLQYETTVDNGVITVVLNAECLEQIGVVSPLRVLPEPDDR